MKRIALLVLLVWAQLGEAYGDERSHPTTLTFGYGKASVTNLEGYTEPDVLSADVQHNLFRYFGVSFGIRRFDSFEAEGVSTSTLDLAGANLSAVVNLPIGRDFEIFAKTGITRWRIWMDTAAATSVEEEDNSLTTGAGIKINLIKHRLGLSVEAERMADVSGADIDRWSAAWHIRF